VAVNTYLWSSDTMKTATAKEHEARISPKHSAVLFDVIRGKKVDKAKKLLENLISEKISLKGKYYTKTSKKILAILKTAEANAKNKSLDIGKLWIKKATVGRGRTFVLPKSRMRLRGRTAKSSNIEIVLEER